MEETGYMETITSDEKEVLLKFKAIAQEMPDVPKELLFTWHLLRFCRARKFDLNKIVAMFKKFIEWKKENNLINSGEIDMTQYKNIKDNYVHGFYHTCKEGRPIYIERVNGLKPKLMFANYTDEQLVSYYIQSYDRYFQCISSKL
jgi:hypothetical protein